MLIQTLQGHFLNIFQQLKATDYVLDFIPFKKKTCCSSEQRAFQLHLNEQSVREVTLLMYLNGFVLTRHPQ